MSHDACVQVGRGRADDRVLPQRPQQQLRQGNTRSSGPPVQRQQQGRAAPGHRAVPSGSSKRGLHWGEVALGSLSRAAPHLGKVVHLRSRRPGLHLGRASPLASRSRGLGPGRLPKASGSRAGWHPGGAVPGSSRGGLHRGKARPGSSRMQGPTLGRAGAAISLKLVLVVVVGGAAGGPDSLKATLADGHQQASLRGSLGTFWHWVSAATQSMWKDWP